MLKKNIYIASDESQSTRSIFHKKPTAWFKIGYLTNKKFIQVIPTTLNIKNFDSIRPINDVEEKLLGKLKLKGNS